MVCSASEVCRGNVKYIYEIFRSGSMHQAQAELFDKKLKTVTPPPSHPARERLRHDLLPRSYLK